MNNLAFAGGVRTLAAAKLAEPYTLCVSENPRMQIQCPGGESDDACVWSAAVLAASAGAVLTAAPSPLYVRGYTVIPDPQKVELKGPDFPFDDGWRLAPGEGVRPNDVALESLKEQLAERHGLRLSKSRTAAVARTRSLISICW
jgi:hypothetical protein